MPLFAFESVTGGTRKHMDKFVLDCLREIAVAAQSIEKAVGKIVGWEIGNTQFGSRQAEQNKSQSDVDYIGGGNNLLS